MTQQNGTAVDLTAFMPQDTAELEILKPGGLEGTGWLVTFAGPSHPKAVEWADRTARRLLRRQAQIEAQVANSRKVKAEERDIAEIRRDNAAAVVARIVGWTPVRIGGEDYEFSEERATALLMRPDMQWALAQMVEFLGAEQSFTPRSAAS